MKKYTENEVADVQGLATNENEFETLKNAWKELLERACEDSVQDIENELDDGVWLFDPSTVRQYADEAEAAQDLYNMIDECEDMEEYEGIRFKKYLADMRIPNRTALMEYAIDDVGIDEEIVKEMCKVFDKED